MRRSFVQQGSRSYKFIIGSLRSLLIILLGLALADPRMLTRSEQVNIFFCLDISESVESDNAEVVEEFFKQATAGMGKKDLAGLIVFGKHPSLEISLRNDFVPHIIRSDVNTNFTNLSETLQFAIGKFPQKGKNRIVLLTDGNENIQDSTEMAYLAASLGIEIYPVPLTSWFGQHEVFINTLDTPSMIPLETPFEVRTVIISSQETQGELVLLRNDTLLTTQTINLQPGKNAITFADTLSEPGLYRYKAVINVPGDVFFQNNEGLSFTKGAQKSQILYLTSDHDTPDPLAESLTIQGLHLVLKTISDLNGSIYDLLEYNAIILNNVPGQSLPFTTMENIERYVKDMGGGLLMIGGDKSFGAGFYKKTPVENVLPVYMDAPTELQLSTLCLIFVIDKSSSMTTRYERKSKLEMAKIAAFSSIELLNPTDRVGIVAFDSSFKWIVPVIKANRRQEIADRLTQINEGGGTHLYPALEDAFRILEQVDATRKHVIVLSDGMTDEADFQSLVGRMSTSGISVSTVSIGTGADKKLMKSIAKWGKGRSYYTDNPDAIPKIFTGETKIVSKELITEKTIRPSVIMPHEMLQGIDDKEFPAIYGQIVTYPKPGASTLLNTENGPLLAAWRYGLGRSVAFTSDLSGRWGKDWVTWGQYGRFVAQMVKWAQRKETPRNYAATIERNGEYGTFTVDVTDNQNQFVNHLDLNAKILFPSERSQTLTLEQIAPGRYQTAFPSEDIGDYYFSLFGTGENGNENPQVFGFGIPYTDEFSSTGVNTTLLERLASLTNGKVLTFDNIPGDLFRVQSDLKEYGKSLWPYFALAFLLLLLVDVAARKLLNPGKSTDTLLPEKSRKGVKIP